VLVDGTRAHALLGLESVVLGIEVCNRRGEDAGWVRTLLLLFFY